MRPLFVLEESACVLNRRHNVGVYWFTRTAGSAAMIYYETRQSPLTPRCREVPVAVARFPCDIEQGQREAAAHEHQIARWTDMPRGGHFAALEAPELLIADVRAFFSALG